MLWCFARSPRPECCWHILWTTFIILWLFPVPATSVGPPTSRSTSFNATVHLPTHTHHPSVFPTTRSFTQPNHHFPPPPPTNAPIVTHTHSIRPTSTRKPGSGSHSRSSQSPIVIFFEVLGGVIGICVLAGLLYSCFFYKKTPRRDRVSTIISRYQLQRELEEMRYRAPITPLSFPEPAPPYLPRPPSYEEPPFTGTRNPESGYQGLPPITPGEQSHSSPELTNPLVSIRRSVSSV